MPSQWVPSNHPLATSGRRLPFDRSRFDAAGSPGEGSAIGHFLEIEGDDTLGRGHGRGDDVTAALGVPATPGGSGDGLDGPQMGPNIAPSMQGLQNMTDRFMPAGPPVPMPGPGGPMPPGSRTRPGPPGTPGQTTPATLALLRLASQFGRMY